MIKLTTQAAIIGFGRLLNTVVAAGTMMLLVRIMPDKESYSVILLLITLYVMLSQIFLIGMPQAIYFFLPRYQGGEQRGFLTQIMLLLAASGLLLSAGLYFGAGTLGWLLNSPRLPELLRVFALYPFFMLPTQALEAILLTDGRPVTVTVFNVLIRVGMFCSLVIPTWLHMSLVRTVSIWVISSGVMCAASLWLMYSVVRRFPLRWHGQMLRDVWHFSLPLAALTFVSLLGSYLDRFIVSRMFGVTAFGAYSNATVEIPTVTMIINATSVVLLAEFSRRRAQGEDARILATWHSASIKTGILILASFGFLIFWSHETMQLIFTSRFAESGIIFNIMVWGIPLSLFAVRPLYIACGATSMLAWLSVWNLAVNVVCMLVGGHYFGLLGIAYGVMLGGYLNTGPWIHYYVTRLTKIGWADFMPWRTIGITLLVAFGAGGATRLLLHGLAPHWPLLVTFIAAMALYIVCYAAGLAVTHLLPYVLPASWLRWAPRMPLLRRVVERP